MAAAVALAAVAALGLYLGGRELSRGLPRLGANRACTVEADGRVELTSSQMANAATIAAVGLRRKMPEHAVVVALATAFQESKLENLPHGDRDSVGLFQQRPSQGWGTPEQIRDPQYAADRFYAALRKVRGWQDMRVTDAAQAVQRSAFPEAYEQWVDESKVLAKALVGDASGAVSCTVARQPEMRGSAAADALLRVLTRDWGQMAATVPAKQGDLAVSAADARTGWRYAHWLVSHASDHGVKRVRFGDLQWTADKGTWSPVTDEQRVADQVVAEVFDEL